jgi:diacylglycerol O-acyltransferase / wax synthase
MSGFMRDSDAFAWYMEDDPTLRSTVVAVVWLERAPDWDVLVAKLERATRIIPSFRQRVVEPPLWLATPRWTADETFDLARHLHRVDASEARTRRGSNPTDIVMTIAREAATEDFDRSRPLWDFTLIEHLGGERAALVMKLHHSLTDGVGGMQLALLLFDLEAHPVSPPPVPPVAPSSQHAESGDLILLSLVRSGERIVDLVTRAGRSAIPRTLRVARHPVSSLNEVVETVRSVGRTVAPVSETMSPIMKGRGVSRHVDVLELQLSDLKRAAAIAGGSVNDGFLAGVTGGLRRYHARHAVPVDQLRVTLPISIRTPEDPIGGNRITLIRFAVPVADPDPASRIHEIGRLCRTARHERSLQLTDAIAATLNLLPRAVVGGMLKHVDFVASDVAGFTFPVYLAGARIERNVAFGPTTGTAANFTLLSHDGTCCVGINIDTAAVPDPDVLVECMREGFEEILVMAGRHDRVRLPLDDRSSMPKPFVARPAHHAARQRRRTSAPRSKRPVKKEAQEWSA